MTGVAYGQGQSESRRADHACGPRAGHDYN